MNFNLSYLPKSDVVFTVMFLNKQLCEKTLSAILDENIELIDIVAESKNDLHQAALNSIYFDIKTMAKDGRIITLDLQRKYIKDRVRNRTIYYACREIASQEVKKGKYENLKNVIVSFLLTEAPLRTTTDNTTVMLQDIKTNNKYSDLLTIHEVNIQRISAQNSQDMRIIRAFFEIENQDNFDDFVKKYEKTDLGKLLLKNYISAVNDTSLLDALSEEDKFMYKLSEEERLEERQEGLKEGLKEGKKETARNMLRDNMPIDTIIKYTGLSEEEIKNLSPKQ